MTTEMVEQLGPAGMSSDESEVDAKTKKVTYRICKHPWRSSACKDRVTIFFHCSILVTIVPLELSFSL